MQRKCALLFVNTNIHIYCTHHGYSSLGLKPFLIPASSMRCGVPKPPAIIFLLHQTDATSTLFVTFMASTRALDTYSSFSSPFAMASSKPNYKNTIYLPLFSPHFGAHFIRAVLSSIFFSSLYMLFEYAEYAIRPDVTSNDTRSSLLLVTLERRATSHSPTIGIFSIKIMSRKLVFFFLVDM